MSIELIDDNGSLGQLASNQGHRDLIAWVKANGKKLKALSEFTEDGECNDIPMLAADVDEAIKLCEDGNIKNTLQNLSPTNCRPQTVR